MSQGNPTLEGCIHFPLNGEDQLSDSRTAPSLVAFCDANWGPQDASVPHPGQVLCRVSIHETRSICSHVFTMGGAPLYWKTHKEARGGKSSFFNRVKLLPCVSQF